MRPAPLERPARNSPSERGPICIGLFHRRVPIALRCPATGAVCPRTAGVWDCSPLRVDLARHLDARRVAAGRVSVPRPVCSSSAMLVYALPLNH